MKDQNKNTTNANRSNDFDTLINMLMIDTKSFVEAYKYWKIAKRNIEHGHGSKNESPHKLDFYFDSMPFDGNFGVVAGIDMIISFLHKAAFTNDDIVFLKSTFSSLEEEFFEYLRKLDISSLEVYGFDNGDVFFDEKKHPVISIYGELPLLALISTPVKSLLSFNSLICTNALRMKLVAGKNKALMEFGLRRAQGPLAGLFASKYAYLGGFESVSNVLAGFLNNIPVRGTCAHAYIMAYQHQVSSSESKKYLLEGEDLMAKCLAIRRDLDWEHTNLSELEAFVSFSRVYKDSSLLLVDTFHTIESGCKNAVIVAAALNQFNMSVRGIRLDSGDLAGLSKQAKALFENSGEKFNNPKIKEMKVAASNDINEKSLTKFNQDGHQMDIFGIGTNLVTCQAQPFIRIRTNLNTGPLVNVGYLVAKNKEVLSCVVTTQPFEAIKISEAEEIVKVTKHLNGKSSMTSMSTSMANAASSLKESTQKLQSFVEEGFVSTGLLKVGLEVKVTES